MKIEINLSNDELVCINNQMQESYARRYGGVEVYDVIHSIAQDLADKFDTKTKSRIKKANIFDARKKTKITLKYHEAWALKAYLAASLPRINNDYQYNLLQKQINHLDQKMK